ncbi:MAG: Mammalian cell entry related domain protein [Verrucomicrobia bacterium]|nr:Mammalian cell entry related domain protein [Verrucomicrobiota bacterium]
MAPPAPRISRFPRVSLIWVVPLVALGVAAWMLYRENRNHGPEITIEFADGAGLEGRQTKLEYKGVTVGEVRDVQLDPELRRVNVRVRLVRGAEKIAREGAEFWIVEPEIGFAGVSGLETLLTGSKLGVRLGAGPPARHFRGLEAPPAPENTEEGRAYILQTDRVGGLQVRAPVFYRDVKVGEVESTRLAQDSTGVQIRIRVQEAYVPLVRTTTRFWNAGGAPLQFSLFGRSPQRKSLQSIITGAIAFATPDEPGETAVDGAVFSLHKSADDDWLKWHPAIPIEPKDPSPPRPMQKAVPGLSGG